MLETELVFSLVCLVQIAPVACLMPAKEFQRLLLGFAQRIERARGGDNVAEEKPR
jgi:hypothetical protein